LARVLNQRNKLTIEIIERNLLNTKRILLKDRQYKKDNLLSNSIGDGKDYKSTADLLQAIYGEAQDAIILFNTKGDLRIECNFKAFEFFEINSRDVLSNIEIFKYLKESLKIGKGDNIFNSISDSGAWNGEVNFETKSGNVLWGDVAIRIVKIKDNEYYLTRIVNINSKNSVLSACPPKVGESV
jgi:hypothetical protein